MRVAVCDDNAQDIERIKCYTIRIIEYAVLINPEKLVAICMEKEQRA